MKSATSIVADSPTAETTITDAPDASARPASPFQLLSVGDESAGDDSAGVDSAVCRIDEECS